MRKLTSTSAVLLALFGTTPSYADQATPGRELAELVFGSIETSQSEAVDMGEFVRFGHDIFVSMDANDSGAVDFTEFKDWDFGFNYIAEDEGQLRAFETAQKMIFAFWDHDADGQIARREYHKSMVWDFRRADVDDDALLSRGEFLSGYLVILAYRAAITGQ